MVMFMVANVPWQKVAQRRISPPDARLDMVKAAVAGHDGLEVSDLELRRGGESYTVDTLVELRSAEPDSELFLIVGSDLIDQLTTWKRWAELPPLCCLAIARRPGSADVGEVPNGWRTVEVRIPALEISSTELRTMAAEGRPLDFLVPAPAVDVIERHGLYR